VKYAVTYWERGSSISGWSYDLSFDIWDTMVEAREWLTLLESQQTPWGGPLYRICGIEPILESQTTWGGPLYRNGGTA
jgi:hypothetical protein